jgi:hypothetical protein
MRLAVGSLTKIIYALSWPRPHYLSRIKVLYDDINKFLGLNYRFPDINELESSSYDNLEHISGAMNWLCLAQDKSKCGGVSRAYSLMRGWEPAYPEVTGYIVPTFFDYYHFSMDGTFKDRAIRMADWLVSIQLAGGSFQKWTVAVRAQPSAFNTGQIIFGFIRAFKETQDEKYLESAKRAGNWLTKIQEDNGSWIKHATNNVPHSYYTRVAWALSELWTVTNDLSYIQAAIKNLEWATKNILSNGYIDKCSFGENDYATTHTIVYAARGLFESGVILNEEKYIQPAQRVVEALTKTIKIKRFLCGEFDDNWKSPSLYSCLTGDAQLSGLLMRFCQIRRENDYLIWARIINKYLRSTQLLETNDPGVLGGIKGSDPIWGRFFGLAYPSWAAKFFVDALLLETSILNNFEIRKLS